MPELTHPYLILVQMQKIFIIASVISLLAGHLAPAAEVDSITPRGLHLENSLTDVDRIFNERIREGIEKANEKQSDIEDLAEDEFCDADILYTEMRKAIFQSLTATWGFKGYELDKQLRILLARQSYSLALNDSIYRDISYLDGFSLNIKELSDVVNINGHLIGLDKIGHFFAEGWQYFELTAEDGESIEQALDWGRKLEIGRFGYSTTGIFSFADLVANFNGWRFWNKVLLKSRDPLKGFTANFFNRPYVTCELQIGASIRYRKIVRAWKLNTQFHLSDYLDGAWDEGNNCNSYADPAIEKEVALRIHQVKPDFTCPLIPAYCREAQKKYGTYARSVLHPHCLVTGAGQSP